MGIIYIFTFPNGKQMTKDILQADSKIVTIIEGDSLLDISPIVDNSFIQLILYGESAFDQTTIEYF